MNHAETDHAAAFLDEMISRLQQARADLYADACPLAHNGHVGAALWTVFDRIWMERMGRKDPVSPSLFQIASPYWHNLNPPPNPGAS